MLLGGKRTIGVATDREHDASGRLAALVGRLETRLEGRIGVVAEHVPSGTRIGIAADERFPMASTYKVPIAGALLTQVDRGEVSLDDMVTVTQRHLEETGPIAQSVRHPGIALSAANLVELMLTQSNNNATDRVIELAGGTAAVTAWVRSIGITGIDVSQDVNTLLNRYFGFPDGTASFAHATSLYTTAELEAVSSQAKPEFDRDIRDSATPAAMVDLLRALFWSDVLTRDSRTFLYEVMTRCETGLRRIRGLLPEGTRVADKTGTVGGTINNVGVIELPDDAGAVLIAVMTKSSRLSPYSVREPVIAELARAIYDYFLWTAAN